MFDQGAAALRALGVNEEVYACPLCGSVFDISALTSDLTASQFLTLEHAPPKSMGGKAIALTCNRCNNSAGSKTDHHLPTMRGFEGRVKGFLRRTSAGDGEVRLKAGRAEVRATLVIDNGITDFRVLGHNNDPKMVALFLDEMQENQPGGSFKITFISRATRSGVARAYVKSAFLVAFAKLGYSFALNDSVTWLREAIILDSGFDFGQMVLPESMQLAQGIYFVQNAQFFVVSLMQRLVILPMPKNDKEALVAELATVAWGKVLMKKYPMPNGIEAHFDKRDNSFRVSMYS